MSRVVGSSPELRASSYRYRWIALSTEEMTLSMDGQIHQWYATYMLLVMEQPCSVLGLHGLPSMFIDLYVRSVSSLVMVAGYCER